MSTQVYQILLEGGPEKRLSCFSKHGGHARVARMQGLEDLRAKAGWYNWPLTTHGNTIHHKEVEPVGEVLEEGLWPHAFLYWGAITDEFYEGLVLRGISSCSLKAGPGDCLDSFNAGQVADDPALEGGERSKGKA